MASDTYIYHNKSKSFGHGRRAYLSRKSTYILFAKHGEKVVSDNNNQMIYRDSLNRIRSEIQTELCSKRM